MSSRITVEIGEQWPEELLERLVPFYSDLTRESVWGGRWELGADYHRWKCATNPAHPSVGAFVYDRGELVGSVVVSFKYLSAEGRKLLVGELGNVLIFPKYRAFFNKLVFGALERCRVIGAELVYSIPAPPAVTALAATGAFHTEEKADHLTWIQPLRPLSVVAGKLKLPEFLSRGDFLFQGLAAAAGGRGPASDSLVAVGAEEATADRQVTGGATMQGYYDQEFLQYRIAEHPSRRAYLQLKPAPNDAGGSILRTASYAGQHVLIACHISHSDMSSYRREIDRISRLARRRGAAFLALWAPKQPQFNAALARRLFVPVQKKSVMVAESCCSDLAARHLDRWQIEMLDSDKV